MNVSLKIRGDLLDQVRIDLDRSHPFAHERVGFLTAGAAADPQGGLILLVRAYQSIEDNDYEEDRHVGARIGSNAMRKAAQSCYRPPASLLHIHTHGGLGRPGFSRTDLQSAAEFVPGFFETAPRMPHGLLVLSDTSVSGLLWLSAGRLPVAINRFLRLDAPVRRDWSAS